MVPSYISRAERPELSISVPFAGNVRVTAVQPLVDSLPFQMLGLRKQLGFMSSVFRGADHTRFEHSLVVYRLTCRRMDRLLGWGGRPGHTVVTEQDVRNVEVAALLHDIGHGPGSHLTDPLVSLDHEERGVEVARSLQEEIEACGAQFDQVILILQRVHPLSCIIFDTPLGTDKLAYLWIDSEATNLGGMPPVDQFLDNVYYCDGQLVADVRIDESVRRLIEHYRAMYSAGYYRKAVSIIERRYQQLTARMLEAGEITVEELVQLSDNGLIERMINSHVSSVNEGARELMVRQQPRSAVVLTPGQSKGFFAPDSKPIACRTIDLRFFEDRRITQPTFLDQLEQALAEEFSLSPEQTVITPPLLKRRFMPPLGVRFRTNAGTMPMVDYWPELSRLWEEEAPTKLRFHVCVGRQDRQRIAAAADEVTAFMTGAIDKLLESAS